MQGYCDSDWAGQKHCHSILGYSYHFGIGAVTWSSKKQHIIALSITEAEYIAQTHTAKEGIWLQTFVAKILGGEPKVIKINCDNQGAISLAKDNKFHSRTKHIDLHYQFIWEAVDNNKINLAYIPTDDNVSDIHTYKGSGKAKIQMIH